MPLLHAFPLFAAALIAQLPAAPAPEAGSTAAVTPPAAPAITPLPSFSWSLLAKEPLVQDPVSFCVADDGSLFIAESFRQEKGVEDNRSSKFWLDDDLQLQSVEDRLKMYEKWASKREGGMDYYRKEEDRVTHLVDTNGDGIPDKVTSFSGPMNEPLDGTGVADVRENVLIGLGIRTALRGHDMHGLVQSPDGRVHRSIGDRARPVSSWRAARW
jgi:quinoprotein glucose dehydrogenase